MVKRTPFVAVVGATVLLSLPLSAFAADRSTYLAYCEKDNGAEATAKCACVADKIDATFKDKAMAFAYSSLTEGIGALSQADSGLNEDEEDRVVGQTYVILQGCGLAK